MKPSQPVYTLCHVLYHGADPTPRFAFHAANDGEARSKALGWARYHSFDRTHVSTRPATENEAANWLHDEYVS